MAEQQILFPASSDGDGDDDSLTLARFAQQAYLDYAISVVKGRALPDGSDGQKPVQRRILYAMNAMGLASGARPVKSARVVGDVLGRYHPHGDQAAYDAMVRMAQDFSLRYPLIDGQGNFGSRDGDGAAAMRYTEARLTPIARLLLDEIDEGTVDFMPNYDGSTQEPRLLPARLPFVLLNGASGIAVGMATEIPSHQFARSRGGGVAAAEKSQSEARRSAARNAWTGFPGGWSDHLVERRHSGRVRERPWQRQGACAVRVRRAGARAMAVGGDRAAAGCVGAARVGGDRGADESEGSRREKSAEQRAAADEATGLSVLDTVRDESGKEAAVRLVFEPRTSKIDRDEFTRTLLAHTSMEGNAPINLVMIGGDGRPRCKPLTEVLLEWIEFRITTVRRRRTHRLQKVDDRIHILEGRQLVLLSIDKVIKLIRNSDEPKPELIKRVQAVGAPGRRYSRVTSAAVGAARRDSAWKRSLPSCARSNRRSASCSGRMPRCASWLARKSRTTPRSTAKRISGAR